MLTRAAPYARYAKDGRINKLGHIFELDVQEHDVHWEEDRTDCIQGRLIRDLKPARHVVCDVELKEKKAPVRPKNVSGSDVWADGRAILWEAVQ